MTAYTRLGPGDLDDEPITYREPEPSLAPVCFVCLAPHPSAVIHHCVEGRIYVCPSCHAECSEAGEILPIPTVLLDETPRPVTARSLAIAFVDVLTNGGLR